MMKYAPTPGPWKVAGRGDGNGHLPILADGKIIAAVRDHGNLEDARLIAACPEMFAALQRIFEWVDAGCDPSSKSIDCARAAISNATGDAEPDLGNESHGSRCASRHPFGECTCGKFDRDVEILAALEAATECMETVSARIPVENRHKGTSQATHVRHMAGHLAQHAKLARAAIAKATAK